jgi:hypothetical protein
MQPVSGPDQRKDGAVSVSHFSVRAALSFGFFVALFPADGPCSARNCSCDAFVTWTPSGDVCFGNTGMTMTKKQVSKFLTVLTRVETLEKELEPGKERERLSDAKLELQRVLSIVLTGPLLGAAPCQRAALGRQIAVNINAARSPICMPYNDTTPCNIWTDATS